jgi:hypothetical protein
MTVPETAVATIAKVDRLIGKLKTEDRKPLFLEEPASSAGLTMTMVPKTSPIDYDIKGLEEVLLGAIGEYDVYAADKEYRTELLKNTNQSKTMLLDRLRRVIPQYHFLKCVSINQNNISLSFTDPLDLDVIEELVTETSQDLSLRPSKSKREAKIEELLWDGRPAISIADYSISIPYRKLLDEGELERGMQAATELTTKIHLDTIFNRNIRTIFLADYQPIFNILFPEIFEDRMTEFLWQIKNMKKADFAASEDFKVTKPTRGSQDKRYGLDKKLLPDHMSYIVVSPDKQELYIRLGSNLDYRGIDKLLKNMNLHFSEPRERKAKMTKTLKKGGGGRLKYLTYKLTERDVLTSRGYNLLTFEGNNIIIMNLNLADEVFGTAIEVVKDMYYGKHFYTGMLPSANLGSDLSDVERMVIESMNNVARLYNFFLALDEDQRRFYEIGETTNALSWIAEKMRECPENSLKGKNSADVFNQRMLYVLTEMDKRVKELDPRKLGKEPATQANIVKNGKVLSTLIGRFEALCYK